MVLQAGHSPGWAGETAGGHRRDLDQPLTAPPRRPHMTSGGGRSSGSGHRRTLL